MNILKRIIHESFEYEYSEYSEYSHSYNYNQITALTRLLRLWLKRKITTVTQVGVLNLHHVRVAEVIREGDQMAEAVML